MSGLTCGDCVHTSSHAWLSGGLELPCPRVLPSRPNDTPKDTDAACDDIQRRPRHGGLREMLRERKAPAVKRGWPSMGSYVSGAARFPNDPKANFSTKDSALETLKRQGKGIVEVR